MRRSKSRRRLYQDPNKNNSLPIVKYHYAEEVANYIHKYGEMLPKRSILYYGTLHPELDFSDRITYYERTFFSLNEKYLSIWYIFEIIYLKLKKNKPVQRYGYLFEYHTTEDIPANIISDTTNPIDDTECLDSVCIHPQIALRGDGQTIYDLFIEVSIPDYSLHDSSRPILSPYKNNKPYIIDFIELYKNMSNYDFDVNMSIVGQLNVDDKHLDLKEICPGIKFLQDLY